MTADEKRNAVLNSMLKLNNTVADNQYRISELELQYEKLKMGADTEASRKYFAEKELKLKQLKESIEAGKLKEKEKLSIAVTELDDKAIEVIYQKIIEKGKA